MTYPNDNGPPNDRQRSPTAWIVGACFVLAIVGAALFYNGKDSSTPSDPNKAPSVMTGSNNRPADAGK
ncbi:hypothetical protein I6F35_05745 [Bradyrhizobium sp. BRP22]|uniref:hypothetical protein n=1 Tax=Bradyrhizobium sp. BRP22 TaxID=2793821 RepID=UPI001CD45279|nr:hypothetical protein [Bradyrhizobium sp. BRP22]MCA1452722.1 hypothetical protein [Bradyrhizobium sp. BRP22]